MSSSSTAGEELPLLPVGEMKKPSLSQRIQEVFTMQYWREKMTPETLRIVICFVLLVCFGIANNITGRWNQLKFGNDYALFNNQWTTFLYCVLAQIITTYKYYFTNDFTPEMKAFPKWKFAMFGLFDGTTSTFYLSSFLTMIDGVFLFNAFFFFFFLRQLLVRLLLAPLEPNNFSDQPSGTAAFLFSIGAPSTPGTLQNVINQMIIPFTMAAAFVVLRVGFSSGIAKLPSEPIISDFY